MSKIPFNVGDIVYYFVDLQLVKGEIAEAYSRGCFVTRGSSIGENLIPNGSLFHTQGEAILALKAFYRLLSGEVNVDDMKEELKEEINLPKSYC